MRINSDGNTLIKSEAQFTFELKGESQIEAQILSEILSNTVEVIDQIVQGEPDAYAKLQIAKFSTGSFNIIFQAIAEQIKSTICTPETLAASIIQSVGYVFQIVKHLKGKEPQKIETKEDSTTIVNHDGEVLAVDKRTAYKFFNNSKIENSVINVLNVVEKDTERPGFDMNSEDGDLIASYEREDFKHIKPVVEKMLKAKEEVFTQTIETTLIIRKPDLMGKSKWGFVFTTNMEATIEDFEWLEKIRDEKIRFCAGMRLTVKMRIDTTLDDNGYPVGTIYTILEVTGDIIEPDAPHTQMNIQLE